MKTLISSTLQVLVIADTPALTLEVATSIEAGLEGDVKVHQAVQSVTALNKLADLDLDLVVTASRLSEQENWLADLIQHANPCPVMVLSAEGGEARIISALRQGASDFFIWPLQKEEVAFMRALSRLLQRGQLVTESRRYRDELEESLALLREDQQAGRHVQRKMLPPSELVINDYRFEYRIKPSLFLSGDFIDFFRISESLCMFYLADISGHGASSAFVTVLLKNMTNRLLRNYNRGSSFHILSPTDVLARINKELLETGLGKHLTIFVGLLDRVENTLQYGVGGHYPMPILTQGGKSQFLKGRGMPVGLFEEAEYDGRIVELEDEFTLTLFSDGIIEILPQRNLEEKEAFLLEKTAQGYEDLLDLARALGADQVSDAPDDIAALSVSRVV